MLNARDLMRVALGAINEAEEYTKEVLGVENEADLTVDQHAAYLITTAFTIAVMRFNLERNLKNPAMSSKMSEEIKRIADDMERAYIEAHRKERN